MDLLYTFALAVFKPHILASIGVIAARRSSSMILLQCDEVSLYFQYEPSLFPFVRNRHIASFGVALASKGRRARTA